MAVDARDVLEVLSMFEASNLEVWVEGGWGIDALVGGQTRDHGDLDLIVDASRCDDARALLRIAGFDLIFEDPPGRSSHEAGDGRVVDLCVTAADRHGARWCINDGIGPGDPDYPPGCFTTGWIGGQPVRCLGAAVQVKHHCGYETEEVDVWDLTQLRDRFGIALPEALR